MEKRCGKCGFTLPITYFYKRKEGGYRTPCKACDIARQKGYRIKYKERHNELNRLWYRNHREKCLDLARARRCSNREAYNRSKVEWAHKNREKRKVTLENYKLKQRLITWFRKNNRPISRIKFDRFSAPCNSCGMETPKHNLFLYDNNWTCVDCLQDVKDCKNVVASTVIVIRKTQWVTLPKETKKPVIDLVYKDCPKCGRTTSDLREGRCPDCRIKKKRRIYLIGEFLT